MRLPCSAPAVLSLSLLLLGCAPCKKVHASHDAFLRDTAPLTQPRNLNSIPDLSGPHLSLSIPYEVLDAVVARELKKVPTAKVPLPQVSGVSLGTLTLAVDSVRARPAPKGQLGFRVIVGLRQGKKTVLQVNVDARVQPHLDPQAGELVVALSGKDVVALEPSLDANGRKQLGEWIWSQLPPAARMVVDKGAVSKIAGDVAAQLMRQAAETLRRELLDDLGELVRYELDLPEALPLSAISLQAGERHLDLDLQTLLKVAVPLPAPPATGDHPRQAGLHPNLIQVRIAGDTMAALANHAIREGRIPERWTLAGEPDPQGPVYVGVGWAEGAPDPIEILLWTWADECAHVILRGEPHLKVNGKTLELGTPRARVEKVVGSFKVRAGLFFDKTARKGLPLIEQTAAATEIEIAGGAMAVEVAEAMVVGDEVILGLRLAQARGR
ncbi:MAG: hypothetical protein KC431_08915 [Myxococcales bacterium]|nr:hypothetical protein [Myxococcales bacterium]